MNKKNSLSINLFFILVFILITMFLYNTITTFGKVQGEGPAKIGFILDGYSNDDGWNEANLTGIKNAAVELKFDIIMEEKINGSADKLYEAVKSMAEQGCRAIVFTSPDFVDMFRDHMDEFPRMVYLCNSPEDNEEKCINYSVRLYQARYLSGIVAGSMTKTGILGFVSSVPNAENIRGINAFTIGVRKTNPEAVVKVIYTGIYSNRNFEKRCAESLVSDFGADIITENLTSNSLLAVAKYHDIFYISYHHPSSDPHELCRVSTNWSTVYTGVLRDFLKGTMTKESRYWYGIDKDCVNIKALSEEIPDDTVLRVEREKNAILKGRDVFSNVIVDLDGKTRCMFDEIIPDDALINEMDWYVRGVQILDGPA